MTVAGVSRRTVLGWIIAALTVCAAHPADADVPWSFGRWQAQSTFFLDWENQDDKRSQTKYETILFQERIGLRNVGAYIVDPRFLTFDLGGSFGQSQEDAIAASNSPLRVGNGTLYDYAFDGLLFSDETYPITVFANRNQSTLTQGFGGQSDVTFESRGGIFELREGNFLKDYGFLNFSSLLDVRQEFLNEDSSVFGSPFLRDERRNIVRYNAHKGGETSDMDLRYELNNVSDPLNPSDVFDSNTVRAAHSIDFGPTLNRRLDSIFYYFARTGSAPGTYLSLDEGVHVDHHSDLATDYRYSFSQSDSDAGGVTTSNAGSIGLVHQLYHLLTSTLNARGMHQEFPTGSKSLYGGQGGFDYHRSLPWGGQLFVSTAAGYQIDDNNFSSSFLTAVDEQHNAPPKEVFGTVGFTLNNPNVLTDSIKIVDVDRGRAMVPPSDYVVLPDLTRPNFTTVIPQAGATVIQPNDLLEVTYDYASGGNLQYSTTTANARLGAEFPWVATSYEHVLSDQARLAGTAPPQFLINQNLDRFEFEVRHQWETVRAQSSVAYEILRSTIVDSNALRFGQLLAYQPRPDLIAQISGDQYFVDYPGENRRTNSYLVRSTVDWLTPFGLSVSSFAGYREFHDTSIPSDEIADLGVRIHWTYHNLDVAPSFTWTDYLTRLNDFRADLRVTRRWF